MQTPWGDLAVNDAHTHFFSRRFYQSLAAQSGKTVEDVAAQLGWNLPPEDPAVLGRLWAEELDRQGVARAALIASIPGDEPSVIAAAGACPGRFFAFAMVNPLLPADLPPELDAICLFPAMHRYSVADDRVERLLAARPRAVFVHCGMLTVGVRAKLGLPSPFDMRFSNPLDLHAVALRHPETRFLVPHFGAGFFREALMLADLCPNVYLDTSSSNSWVHYDGLDLKAVFRRALDVVGADRLLFGTDSSFFPRGWNHEIFETQTQVLLDIGIRDEDAAAILGANLNRIFGSEEIKLRAEAPSAH
jgi:predicted TIM-barrel fold metal-dependent hydrolase